MNKILGLLVTVLVPDCGSLLILFSFSHQTGPLKGVARIFVKGVHTESYRGYSLDCHLNIVSRLLTKRLTKGGGGHGHPRTPLATPLPLSVHLQVLVLSPSSSSSAKQYFTITPQILARSLVGNFYRQ